VRANGIDETLAELANDSTSLTVDNLSVVPLSRSAPSTPITPAALSGTLLLKRKRQIVTSHGGIGQKDKIVWKHSRQRMSYEPMSDDHGMRSSAARVKTVDGKADSAMLLRTSGNMQYSLGDI
jgi:hypothetical protein